MLLSDATLQKIKAALKETMSTFAQKQIHIVKRTPTTARFGEAVVSTDVPYPIMCLYEPSRGLNARYNTTENSQKGTEAHDGWRIYLWKDDVTALGIDINPEADKVRVDGKDYQIRMFTPSAQFSTLGDLLYEFEVHFTK